MHIFIYTYDLCKWCLMSKQKKKDRVEIIIASKSCFVWWFYSLVTTMIWLNHFLAFLRVSIHLERMGIWKWRVSVTISKFYHCKRKTKIGVKYSDWTNPILTLDLISVMTFCFTVFNCKMILVGNWNLLVWGVFSFFIIFIPEKNQIMNCLKFCCKN